MAKVVSIRHAREGTYKRIDRRTKWGNPYIVGVHGNLSQCLEAYIQYIQDQYDLIADLSELEDVDLGCWCAPPQGLTSNLNDSPLICHGQVLLFMVEENRAIREEMEKAKSSHE